MFPLLRCWTLLVAAAAFSVFSCNASSVDDVLSALQNAVDCASCHAVVLPVLKGLAAIGNDAFVTVLTQICEITKVALFLRTCISVNVRDLQAEDKDVCVGELKQSGPILAHALRNFEPFGTTATKFCEVTLGLCQVILRVSQALG